mmetsp:Transcript_26002/g.35096  ORF Transcript_26002/g.35096 Transcript_26002/m.35096 type:complete len:114 (-) Transcript_26002:82-423(-)
MAIVTSMAFVSMALPSSMSVRITMAFMAFAAATIVAPSPMPAAMTAVASSIVAITMAMPATPLLKGLLHVSTQDLWDGLEDLVHAFARAWPLHRQVREDSLYWWAALLFAPDL